MAVRTDVPPIPPRVNLDDFSAIDGKQSEIVQGILNLSEKLPHSTNSWSTANNTRATFKSLIETMKTLAEKSDLEKEQRLVLRSCKHHLFEAQKDFISLMKVVYKESDTVYDFGNSITMPKFTGTRDSIRQLKLSIENSKLA